MDQQIIWKSVNHPDILPGYLISPQGYIKAKGMKDDDAIKEPSYHSTNGYDFMLLNNKDMKLQLFPLDDIIAYAYIPIPSSLKDKSINVLHINGDTRDVSLENMEWVEDIEEWRDIGDIGYMCGLWKVSSFGKVFGTRYNKMLKQRLCENFQYYSVGGLANENKHGLTRFVHVLVAQAFVRNPYPGKFKMVNHIDGNKLHNYWKNLEWVNNSLNSKHAILTGLQIFKYGDDNHSSKLTTSDVAIICKLLLKYDGNIIAVEKDTGINRYTIRAIRNGRSWRDISEKYFGHRYFIKKRQNLKPDAVKLICSKLIENNMDVIKTQESLKNINIPRSTIWDIKRKKTYKNISDNYF